MDKFLDDLFAKRGSVREGALSSIVDGLNFNYRRFLSITVGCGDNAHELYKESLPLISQALKSRTESLLLSVIDCLAIATFVGANDFEETEASMQIIWHFINLKPGDNVVVSKQSASVLSAAVSAWSLLLTTVDGWNLNHNYWQGAIPYFLDLLEVDDQCVCMAAGEAIALICEMGFLEKFAGNPTSDEIGSNEKGKNIKDRDYSIQELQEIVSNHAKRVSRQNLLQGAATKTVNGWSNFSQNVLEALEDGRFHEASLKIGKHRLQLHSLSQLLQVNSIKRFLGRGFVPHMLENEFLHDVFNFTPREQESGAELYSSEREEAVVHLFVPETRQLDGEDDFGRVQRPQRSAFRKAKTQLLKQQAC
ncbi:UNVERIFIED_CONTAM: hypothetical protein Scaly_0722200 [Sesamum calycinum]|uniref:Interferon-related developmental regulator N-terminal domain-containing protein n=1 Tax=Sesamum calycinum TaxID=2727403 RepID=A0AAW2R8Z8_9LAMI